MEVKNRKANYDYSILKEYEAGIVLKGTEIKSAKEGSLDIKDSYVTFKKDEAYVINMFIAPYEKGNIFNHDERRSRKLLLHKKEIKKLKEWQSTEGISIIPLKAYLKQNHLKLLIGVAKGKKLYDKRETIKKRDLERQHHITF